MHEKIEVFHLASDFPHLTEGLHKPPERLFVQGSKKAQKLLHEVPQLGLGIVGTRDPQPRSLLQVEKSVTALCNSSLIILSGLARGIDATAHAAALRAGIPTIAILGAGLDSTYPPQNQKLRESILNHDGLILSEFPLGTPARAFHFIQRNRLIAAWSKATWIVEAGFRSGALNTARWAREMDRICFATPCYPGDPSFAGNQILLDRDHAFAFWGTHSLGASWMHLAASLPDPQLPLFNSSREQTKEQLKEQLLTDAVKNFTQSQGGVSIQKLLDWALAQGWTPQLFFNILDPALRLNRIKDHQGTLVSH